MSKGPADDFLSVPHDYAVTDIRDLFDLKELQQVQDSFASAFGVASLITDPEGLPLTRSSHFCKFCKDIIPGNEKGRQYCNQVKLFTEIPDKSGPAIKSCLGGTLWESVSAISAGDKHIANWLIGQVKNEKINHEYLSQFATETGIDLQVIVGALDEIPAMTQEQFQKISHLHFVITNQLSEKAFQILELKKQSQRYAETFNLLKQSEEYLSITLSSIGDGVITTAPDGNVINLNSVAEKLCGWSRAEAIGKPLEEIFRIVRAETEEPILTPVRTVIQTGKVAELGNDTVLISQTGERYQIADSAAPITDKNGQILGVVLVFSNITEKYRAQEKIKTSERQFRSLIDNMIEGVAFHRLVYDQQGKPTDYIILETNKAFEVQLGITKENVLNKTSREAYGVEAPPYFKEYSGVVESGAPIFFESYFPPMDKYFSISVYKTSEAGFATIFNDTTISKKVENELRDSEKRWRKALVDSPIPMIVHVENGRILQVSSGWTDFSGYTIEDIPTIADWTEKAYGERRYLTEEYINQLFDLEQTAKNGEWIITAKNGTKRVWDFQTTPLGRNIRGQRILLSLAIDVTDQKMAEEKIRESEQTLQFVLKGSQLGFWDWNLETGEVKRNERWAEMLGYQSKDVEFTVKQWVDFIHPDDKAVAIQSIQDHLDGKTPMHRIEYRMIKKNGQPVWILDQAQAVKRDSSGRIIRMSGTHTDITDRKKAEEEIQRQNERLRKTNAEKDRFFSIIAHDLKSPFNSILGFAELLSQRITEDDYLEEEIQNYAKIIFNSSNHVMELLTNLMEWSRSQTGRIISHPTNFNLKDLVAEVETLFRETSLDKNIRVISAFPDELLLYTDKEMISTILRNLISNALKFTNPGGQIMITGFANDERTSISVKDNGIGISEKGRAKIFNIGESYTTKGTRNEIGTGLGLIICKEFIEKLGGEIHVESEVGKGTEFTLNLPAQPPASQ